MKAIILAGGLGTRLSEETDLKPKPMVNVGGMPIIWHIMKIYSFYNINEFIICCGYKGYVIKEFFLNYFYHTSDITVDLQNNNVSIEQKKSEPWKVTLVDTGSDTMTGGRLKRVEKYFDDNELFMFTYGDGVANIDLHNLKNFHKEREKIITMTCAQPPGRFGSVDIRDGAVTSFSEKPKGDGGYVNAGFFVSDSRLFKYIIDDSTIFEQEPLKNLAADNELNAYIHNGFWQPMDTLRDKNYLESLYLNNAPWKKWK
jgi:glucose-1-phosphate cytidylyltransferase